MSAEEEKSNAAMAYLLGGVGLLAISVVPLLGVVVADIQPTGKLAIMAYWLAGGLAIGWAVRRFTKLGERLVAVLGVVVG